MKRRRKIKVSLKRIFLKSTIYFFSISIGLVLVFKFVPVPITITMLGQWVRGGELHYNWEPIENMSAQMPIAVVAAEDQLFPQHHGFDFKSIKKAIQANQKTEKLRGGSTISQQTAKNVFLWQGRSWIRKGLETYFTFLIELIWGKKRILEVYLNVCEMGPQTFGAEAASQRYFKTPAAKLTRNKAARIAAILPSPRKWKVVNSGAYVNKRTAHIERQIRQLGGPAYLKEINL
ncbi:monofunctional biosynthetic peptidoglycan transglycosylase [Arcticibacterium luteifluviistationis]|uniref:Biosynthetic peptidoglycan transglycosylase n=1 Tax=Arcticibacterium luteifluviistationis TaxID=1784714 RepID=A0A2Z4G6A3_9BACT|nr:monofunctional biosynthetic peptidoglycan transglycosylase [Arcticibacterium luteifluviistationis]AWV96667.1 monofunctional biosynthetic peptidoglycan transglycosylase [Arcticibacterium luteifluviistationis]